jgi:hypothetical protein
MSITGLVLYVVPAGRVAYWTNWEMLGMTKTDWGNIHILSSLLFIVAGGFHTYFNWGPLMNYFRDKIRKKVKLRRELIISLILSVWVIVSSIWPFPPLSYLLDFNEWVRETWVSQDDYEPPFGHAELLSLKAFTNKMDINLGEATRELKARGIVLESTDQTLEEIAEHNNVSPMDIYLLIKKFEPAPEPEKLIGYTPESIEVEFAGTGLGNKTVGSMCERLGLDTTVAQSRLATAEITVALDQTIKQAAESADTEPIEILKLMLIEDYKPVGDKE